MAPYKLGITGSIAMGKTQTAMLFKAHGVPVWDADEAVHNLYKKGREGYILIRNISKNFVNEREVDRKAILKQLKKDDGLLKKIEMQIHPLLRKERCNFVELMQNKLLIVFDIPLLFETESEKWLDGVLVVKTSDEEQERRVLKRGTMSKEQFIQIKSKQMPIDVKCSLATFIIDTEFGIPHVKQEVSKIIDFIKGKENE